MYYFHWLIIKLIWPTARQNKVKRESQTGNTQRKKGRDELAAGEARCQKTDEVMSYVTTHILVEMG